MTSVGLGNPYLKKASGRSARSRGACVGGRGGSERASVSQGARVPASAFGVKRKPNKHLAALLAPSALLSKCAATTWLLFWRDL